MKRPLEVSTTLPAVFERVGPILLDDPGSILCDTCSTEERHERRFRTQVAFDLAGGGRVGHEVTVHAGAARRTDSGTAMPVSWSATGHPKLFPEFDGELEATKDPSGVVLCLRGAYEVPLGVIGRFGDGAVGRRLARRSLATFLRDVGCRLETELDRRVEPVRHAAAVTAPTVIDEVVGPENYVG